MIGNLIGGIGMFLLGMWMMTDGMKTAAGPALERILANATKTRWRGLTSGMLVTAVVQSSSAVTIAAIGFVNAGLLTLGQALWVLFGANVGTTVTGWLVAAAGMGFKVEAAALPLIGVGMLLRLSGPASRRAAVGLALAGFGILFLGIDILKSGFMGVAGQLTLPSAGGVTGIVMHLFAGLLLTILMQSSSAALAVALTAAQGGLLPLEAAAAVVIGANLGTTSTALIAALGATVNARRAAAAHVLFNLLTAVVALAILPWLLQGVFWLRDMFAMDHAPGTALAMFHTTFNFLGVLLMWPLSARLTSFLQTHIRSDEDDLASPHFLDRNLLAVPELAVIALTRELERMGALALELLRSAVQGQAADDITRRFAVIEALKLAITRFVTELNRTGMSASTSLRLTWLLRVLRYYSNVAELAHAIGTIARRDLRPAAAAIETHRRWLQRVDLLCAHAHGDAPRTLGELERELAGIEADYQALKAGLLRAGAEGMLDLASMEALLQADSLARRGVQQATKAARVMANLGAPAEQLMATDDGATELAQG